MKRDARISDRHKRLRSFAPRVGVGGILGLSTIVSAPLEMYPGKDGAPKRDFIWLDELSCPAADAWPPLHIVDSTTPRLPDSRLSISYAESTSVRSRL